MSDEADDKSRINEEMVRRLLQLNPQLRGDGKSTKDVLSIIQKTTTEQPAAGAPPPAERPRELKQTAAIGTAEQIRQIKARYSQRIAALKKEQAEIAAKSKLLASQKKAATDQACHRLIDAILRIDPDLLNRGTQTVMETEAAFLSQVAYSPQKLVAEEKRRRGVK
jgi:molecular chaperone GrpE (heat shock protein)